MSRFLDALEQAEQARKDQEKKPDPQPEAKVNGIGGAAAWLLRDQLPESQQTEKSLKNGKATKNGTAPSKAEDDRVQSELRSALSAQHSASSPSALNSHPSPSAEHSAFSIQHSAKEAGRDRDSSGTSSALGSQLSAASLDQHLVSLVSPRSFEADQYRTLRHVVEQKRAEADVHVIAITSPAVGDGKTLTSINLAGALAQAPGARVLLIDADLRRPSICRQLGVYDSKRKGLVDAILDSSVTFNDIALRLPDFNLSVIGTGPTPSPPYEVLKSHKIGELLGEARANFDYVIIDTPPLVPFPDCRLIGKWVDGFVLVATAHKTPQAQFEEGTSALDQEKIIGIVFNSDDTLAPAKYNFYYKYQRRGRRGWNPFRKQQR